MNDIIGYMAEKKFKKRDSQYIAPEMMPYTLCSACLSVVLDQNEEAKEMFERVYRIASNGKDTYTI